MKAQKSDWKNNPMTETREAVEFQKTYTDHDAELIALGTVPQEMDDKWFIYSEEGWIYIHRSWSGDCIFMVKLDGSPAGVRVTEAWVEKDQRKFNNTDMNISVSMLENLFSGLIQKNAHRKET